MGTSQAEPKQGLLVKGTPVVKKFKLHPMVVVVAVVPVVQVVTLPVFMVVMVVQAWTIQVSSEPCMVIMVGSHRVVVVVWLEHMFSTNLRVVKRRLVEEVMVEPIH
jgi:hypothetical protein